MADHRARSISPRHRRAGDTSPEPAASYPRGSSPAGGPPCFRVSCRGSSGARSWASAWSRPEPSSMDASGSPEASPRSSPRSARQPQLRLARVVRDRHRGVRRPLRPARRGAVLPGLRLDHQDLLGVLDLDPGDSPVRGTPDRLRRQDRRRLHLGQRAQRHVIAVRLRVCSRPSCSSARRSSSPTSSRW